MERSENMKDATEDRVFKNTIGPACHSDNRINIFNHNQTIDFLFLNSIIPADELRKALVEWIDKNDER